MSAPIRAVLPALVRPLVEPRIDGVEALWWSTPDEAEAAAPDAEIGWFDMLDKPRLATIIEAAAGAKWLNTVFAGLDGFPLDTIAARGAVLTNGKGLNAIPVAEFAVAGMLAMAKRLDEIVRAHDRREWPADAPGKAELFESRVLIVGYGEIGRRIGQMLGGFGCAITAMRRSPDPDPAVIGPEDWRDRLGEFDWVVLAAPATDETERMIGAAELAAMKAGAVLVNIARGSLVDQPALREALASGGIAGAFLDTVDPEPLPSDDPLWTAPNALISMHKSGHAQTRLFRRAADRFVENLARYRAGEPLIAVADPALGY